MALSKQAKIALWTTLVIAFIFSGLTVSAAWFKANRSTVSADVTGSVVEEYFHCGNGTASDPYVITRPIHYYHLVEFYQRKTPLNATVNSSAITNNFGSDYLYFQVGFDFDDDGTLEVYRYNDQGITDESKDTTLNMAYYSGENALMPIGTDEVPFIGSFDGGKTSDGGIIISNLNIRCSETIPGGTRSTSDVGVFGYVADSDGEGGNSIIKNAYFDGLNIDLTGVASGSDTASTETSVSHVETHSEEANVGYIVGHLHNYTNYDSSGPTNASPIFDVYVNNAKVQGGAGVKCGYGYVGKVDTIDGKGAGSVEAEIGGTGQGNQWGGSINMKALDERLYNYFNTASNIKTDNPASSHPTPQANTRNITTITKNKTISSYGHWHRYYTDDYVKITAAIYKGSNSNDVVPSGNSNLDNDSLNVATVYRLENGGTKNMSDSTTSGSGIKTISLPGTAIPLIVDEKSKGYATLAKNTGYIVGGSAGTSTFYSAKATIRIGSNPLIRIGNSISSSGDTSATFVDSQLEILTNSQVSYASSGYGRISDSRNRGNNNLSSAMSTAFPNRTIDSSRLKKYIDSRDKLEDILSGSELVHGLHFTEAAISLSNYTQIDTAYLNENTYTNYRMPDSCIDFHLKKTGYINFFAGSYQGGATIATDSFFSLNIINRTGSTLTSTKEISEIYANTNSATKAEYPHVYKYTDGTYGVGSDSVSYTLGSLEFDMQYLWNQPPVDHALYYFEIPVNKGEFAMGNHAGKKTGGYLMYLDIGASAADETHIAETSFFSQIGYSEGAFFAGNFRHSCFNIAYVIPDDANKNNFYVYISVDSSYSYNAATYTCYQLEIKNETGNALNLYALLVDDDDDNNNDYLHMYTIAYNGAAAVPYTDSQLHQLAAYAGS